MTVPRQAQGCGRRGQKEVFTTVLTKAKKPKAMNWSRAKEVRIPIPRTGTKFRQYPDMPARPCEVTASFQFVPQGEGWQWRIKLDAPMFKTDDPDPTGKGGPPHPKANSQENAIRRALAEILRLLRSEVEIRRHHKQVEVASACAQAVWHVEQFLESYDRKGIFLTKPIDPAGKKPHILQFKLSKIWGLHLAGTITLSIPDRVWLGNFIQGGLRLETHSEIQRAIAIAQSHAIVKLSRAAEPKTKNPKPSTAIAVVTPIEVSSQAVEVIVPKASATERKKALRDYHNAQGTLQRGWQSLGEAAIRVQETGAWADEGKQSFEDWIVAERGHSVVRQAMLAVRQKRRFLPIAQRYGLPIDPDVEDHFRPLPAAINGEPITDSDMETIAEETKKLLKGGVPLTGKVLREAVKLVKMDGEELAEYKRQKRHEKAAAAKVSHQAPPAESPMADPLQIAELHRGVLERADLNAKTRAAWPSLVKPDTLAAIASHEFWWKILSQDPLEGLSSIVYRLQALRLGQRDGEFSRDLAARLRSLAAEIMGPERSHESREHSRDEFDALHAKIESLKGGKAK